ncbi:MAG: hypothetical protein QG657_2434 [Acidobacteriota bacterium]|nr:hypothetical protein [Acidobacteriota bacterium]
MKTKNLKKKLVLNKDTIANLANGELKAVYGGASELPTCATGCKITFCASNCVICLTDANSGCWTCFC